MTRRPRPQRRSTRRGFAAAVVSAVTLVSANDARAEDAQPTVDDTPEATKEEKAALRLEVIDRGPTVPWSFRITNDGDQHVYLNGDPRLLWFDVTVPGKAKATTCRLPADLLPKAHHRRGFVVLAPGKKYVRHLDPRFYCYDSGPQDTLVPGAVLEPHFGWPDRFKTRWRHGKRIEEKLPPEEPFVAHFIQPPKEESEEAEETEPPLDDSPPLSIRPAESGDRDDEEYEDQDEDENADQNEETGTEKQSRGSRQKHRRHRRRGRHRVEIDDSREPIKNVGGVAFALNSEYQLWSGDGLDEAGPEETPLAIAVVRGSDAINERAATITIAIANRGKAREHLYFRRELAALNVLRPRGMVHCPPPEEDRSPTPQSFLSLAPGQRMTLAARLVEMCPRGTFARPGLYLVNVDLEAKYSGDEFGMHAYTGVLQGKRPVPVRVRNGELPFLVIRPKPPGTKATAAPAAGAAPAPAAPAPAAPAPAAPAPPPPAAPAPAP